MIASQERNGYPFGARDGRTLITCPLCGAWVGSRDGVTWRCDDGHVIVPTLDPISDKPRNDGKTWAPRLTAGEVPRKAEGFHLTSRWGVGSPARQRGLGLVQGVIAGLLVAAVFWALVLWLVFS